MKRLKELWHVAKWWDIILNVESKSSESMVGMVVDEIEKKTPLQVLISNTHVIDDK